MLKNYFIIAIRNIFRQKFFSVINILGLAIGIACSILIMIWIQHELSYDKFNSRSDRLYRLVQTQHYSSGPLTTTCMPWVIGADIRNEIPEITNSFMFYYVDAVVAYEDLQFQEEILFADAPVFNMLDFTFIKGDPETVFNEINSMVVTDEMAEKLFPNEDPIGKVVKLNNQYSYKVSGIVEKPPTNSSLRFDYCVPFENLEDYGFNKSSYGNNTYYSYVELHPDADWKIVSDKIEPFIYDHKEEPAEERTTDLFLFPFEKIHLYSVRGEGGAIQYVYIFAAIALFILIIACVNYMNLATARSSRRSREIGLRKTLGAERGQIFWQFIGESIITSIIALLLALGLVLIFLPEFNQLASKDLAFNLLDTVLLAGIIFILLFVAFVAGSYPALYLSRFKPLSVLKGVDRKGKGGNVFRQVLVVFQFSLSVILIVCTIIVTKQMHYIQKKNLGIEKENVAYIFMQGETNDDYISMKNELLQSPYILDVCRANSIPFWIGSNSGSFDWEGRETDDDILIGFAIAGYDYIETLGMEMTEGRFFDDSYSGDSLSIIPNETAIKIMGLQDDPLGKWVTWGGDQKYKIVGVIKDFHFLPLSHKIDPLIFFHFPEWCRFMYIKMQAGQEDNALAHIEKTWESYNPQFPFKYDFLDKTYERVYRDEKQLSRIISYFAYLAIFISCLGLFGLAAYLAEQRTKEIGIRKTFGGSAIAMIQLLTGSYLKWILIANLIGLPIAWLLMKNWLDKYAYHTKMGAEVFIFTLLLSLLIALLTVSIQAIRAANRNPVDSLRYE